MSNVVRIIGATKSDFEKMSPMELKESIFKAESRTIMGQHLLFAGPGLVRGVTNSELMFAWGADMVMLNTIDLDDMSNNPGLCGLSLKELKARCNRPIGVYLGCPKAGSEDGGKKALYRREGMVATREHILKCREIGADFIVLGGNPGSGTSLTDVISCTRMARKMLGDDMLIMAGKWEEMALEGDHYRLAFDRENTWSQKYNMIWDKLWGLNLFSDEVYDREIKYYLTVQNKYGLPLDCRRDYTKSDWIMWTAGMAPDMETFQKFVHPVYTYINETESRVPISDWSDTKTAKMVGFKARSVIGGYWMRVLADKLK